MRKNLLYNIFLAVLIGACTPEGELDNVWIGPTCHDGIQNQDEEDIDCGGRCLDCKVFVPIMSPCTSELRDNTLNFDGQNINQSNYACDAGTGYTVGIMIDNRDSFVLHLGSFGKPTESGTYTLVSELMYVDTGEAAIQYDEEGYDYSFKSNGGKVYVNVTKDQTVSIEFCDVKITTVNYWGYEIDYRIVSGRLIGCL